MPCSLTPRCTRRASLLGELRKRLARALLRLHRPDEAEADLRAVLNLGPEREAQWLLSDAALQRGDRATALAAWQSAPSAGAIASTEPAPYVGSADGRFATALSAAAKVSGTVP
ncbi:MAG: hypothetical protein ACLQU5_11990 [Isosphaeraceae bacterium]